MSELSEPRGLSTIEADHRLRALGPPIRESSRSLRSIVAANVFTLFNAIIAVFFVPVSYTHLTLPTNREV